METQLRRIDFDEFASNLGPIFESLYRDGEPILVAKEGRLFKVEPQDVNAGDVWRDYDPDRVREALRESAGAFRGVDREALLEDIHGQRAQFSTGRPGD